jgi:hypothetical protein
VVVVSAPPYAGGAMAVAAPTRATKANLYILTKIKEGDLQRMDVVVVRGAGQDLNEADLIGNDCKDVEKMLFVGMRKRNR